MVVLLGKHCHWEEGLVGEDYCIEGSDDCGCRNWEGGFRGDGCVLYSCAKSVSVTSISVVTIVLTVIEHAYSSAVNLCIKRKHHR